MATRFTCPTCGCVVNFGGATLSRVLKCPGCERVLRAEKEAPAVRAQPGSGSPPSRAIRAAPSASRRLESAEREPRTCGLGQAALAFTIMTLIGGFLSGMTLLSWTAGGAAGWSLGRSALRKIRASGEQLHGRGWAWAAVVLGAIQCLGSILVLLVAWVYLRHVMRELGESSGGYRR